jgi:hypothetical protein
MAIPARPGRSAALSPALARMKGLSYLDEMLDVVDFGVATPPSREMAGMPPSQRVKHPSRLSIQRSEIKSDGGRKRWNCDMERRDGVRGFETAVSGHLRLANPVLGPAVPFSRSDGLGQAKASNGGPKRRR